MNEDLRNLISMAKNGDPSAFSELSEMYNPLMSNMIDSFIRAKGMSENDKDDLLQEASIALFNAIEKYDISQTKVTFGLYAKICIRNRLISLLRKRRKQIQTVERDNQKTFQKSTHGDFTGEIPLGNKESSKNAQLEYAKSVLSQYEYSVFLLYIKDLSYRDIAKKLGKTEKSVDNALSRIKNKMKR